MNVSYYILDMPDPLEHGGEAYQLSNTIKRILTPAHTTRQQSCACPIFLLTLWYFAII
jgi:hypothetical protein